MQHEIFASVSHLFTANNKVKIYKSVRVVDGVGNMRVGQNWTYYRFF